MPAFQSANPNAQKEGTDDTMDMNNLEERIAALKERYTLEGQTRAIRYLADVLEREDVHPVCVMIADMVMLRMDLLPDLADELGFTDAASGAFVKESFFDFIIEVLEDASSV